MITCKYKTGIKIFLKIIFVAISIFSFYCIFKYPLKGEYLLTIPLITACVLGWFYVDSFKIEITDDGIIQYGIKKKKIIDYQEVLKLEIYIDFLIIKSRNNQIRITSDLEKQKEAITFVLDRLKPKQKNLKLKGDKSLVNNFITSSRD